MKIKRIVAVTMALIMMLALMTACKSDKTDNSSDDASGVSSTASSESTASSATSESSEGAESPDSAESSAVESTTSDATTPDTTITSDAPASSDDSTVSDSTTEDDSSEETSDTPTDIVLSDTTYTVVLEKKDNTVNVTVYFPGVANVPSGKLVLATNNDLKYVAGSAKWHVDMSVINEKYPKFGREDLCVSFASANGAIAKGTVVLTAQYTLADGASLSADDIFSPEWRLTDMNGTSTNEKNGNVKVIVK